jgi:hypothetical protein
VSQAPLAVRRERRLREDDNAAEWAGALVKLA